MYQERLKTFKTNIINISALIQSNSTMIKIDGKQSKTCWSEYMSNRSSNQKPKEKMNERKEKEKEKKPPFLKSYFQAGLLRPREVWNTYWN